MERSDKEIVYVSFPSLMSLPLIYLQLFPYLRKKIISIPAGALSLMFRCKRDSLGESIITPDQQWEEPFSRKEVRAGMGDVLE